MPIESPAPLRAKCSADFGTVNTDISVAAVAGTTYTGTTRTFPASGKGILININVPEDQVEDVILQSPTRAPFATWRPLRVSAGGFVGWVHPGVSGFGVPSGLEEYRVMVKAKQAIASLIVTSQVFDY